jgi:hypothetical protein
LLQFREGHATDLETLHKALGIPWPPRNTAELEIPNIVENLMDVGLLEADGQTLQHAKIRVTELLSRLQFALNISLTSLSSFDRYNSMVITPSFGTPSLDEDLDVFVLMPFKDDMLPV